MGVISVVVEAVGGGCILVVVGILVVDAVRDVTGR